ncbi:4'-phosphopantetheinyl transferase superfamily protein [Pseudoduganella namucuonensis]|uniref:4'-phosphopantetheinyl transferase superfamily protein n=1 Tax=Pseudoduganella namucuonensis TaxID=1035707 RepID=A0A1I7GXK5_9BURK|nr:4'-phosphopantetheinyl transferase superfamily protein [Pseudoduganella namucuonensis]SFU53171.1 4'-phosphopantetheinyl transferase superfamily protein [Pseudoduganella namucuonensis]
MTPAMPFLGEVLGHVPGRGIAVLRTLALDEDLHLADHHFVPARPHKPLAACYPVLPMTFSLEAMAEVAACLAPGLGLTGIDAVGAVRWIALEDSATLALRIEARVLEEAGPRGIRVAASIVAGDAPQPAISAELLFGAHYRHSLEPVAAAPAAAAAIGAAEVYASRQLFHGPTLRCLDGPIALDRDDAAGTLAVRAPDRLFRSSAAPQLLTDPALMDGVGQLIGVWAMARHGRVTFPIGLGKLEYYGPTPPPGSRVPIRVRTRALGKLLSSDVEIGDGAGAPWLRIRDWKSWQFRWDRQLLDFRRQPCRHLLSVEQALPAAAGAALVCRCMDGRAVADFDRGLLARHYLHLAEMAPYHALPAARQLAWLLGRIAAKDAARVWAARGGGAADMLHPAAFSLAADERGQPRVDVWPGPQAPPSLSIAHHGERAVAVAHGAPVGVDLERVAAREPACLAAYAGPAELALLPDATPAQAAEWQTRLWCAKEALGKLMGTGCLGSPRRYAALRREPDGALLMRHGPGGREALVHSLREGDLVCAVAADPAPGG